MKMLLHDWITTVMVKADKLVLNQWNKIEIIAKLLIEKEVIEEDELNNVLHDG